MHYTCDSVDSTLILHVTEGNNYYYSVENCCLITRSAYNYENLRPIFLTFVG